MSGYMFYPGCSLEGTARDFHHSTMAVAKAMGLELPQIPDWVCCGSTPAHQTDPLLALALPAQNLAAAGGKPLAVCCAACYSRLKIANHEIAADAAIRKQVAAAIGRDYDGQTPVLHLLEILAKDYGAAAIRTRVTRPLQGLKAACYYGCLLSRPPEVTKFDDAENPTLMDQIVGAAGAQTREVLAMAKAAGANCIVTACPLCQMNLDLRQQDIEKKYGDKFDLPVFYFTQLLGLAMGIAPAELGLKSLIVDPMPLLTANGLAT